MLWSIAIGPPPVTMIKAIPLTRPLRPPLRSLDAKNRSKNHIRGKTHGNLNTDFASSSSMTTLAMTQIARINISATHVTVLSMVINHAQKIKRLFLVFSSFKCELGILFRLYSASFPRLGKETLSNLWKVLLTYRSPFEVRVNEIFFEPLNSQTKVIKYLQSGYPSE